MNVLGMDMNGRPTIFGVIIIVAAVAVISFAAPDEMWKKHFPHYPALARGK